MAERAGQDVSRTGDRGRENERPQGRGEAQGAPRIPDDIEATDLDKEVRAELLSLSKPVADTVARHLVAAGQLIEDDVVEALAHAMAARRMASRIAAVREAVGLAAYAAGEWQTAIAEVRTYHRMTGRQNHLAVLADCERALGRPEKAIDLFRTADRAKLAREDAIELLIVAAGARTDLGQHDAAVAMLQVRELTNGDDEWAARLRYAYADALLAAGRPDEARAWFARTVEIDEESLTDAAERLLELDGVELEDDFDDDDRDEDGDQESGEDGINADGRFEVASESDADAANPDAEVVDAAGDADAVDADDADADADVADADSEAGGGAAEADARAGGEADEAGADTGAETEADAGVGPGAEADAGVAGGDTDALDVAGGGADDGRRQPEAGQA